MTQRILTMRWEELDRDPGPDLSKWSFWCPSCKQTPMWIRGANGRIAEETARCVACWSQCFECKTWVLMQDAEIQGARVLSPDEFAVAQVMES